MDEPRELDPVTARAVAEYVSEVATELARMSRQAGYRAAAEAFEVARCVLEEALQENAAPDDAA